MILEKLGNKEDPVGIFQERKADKMSWENWKHRVGGEGSMDRAKEQRMGGDFVPF